MLTNKQGLTVFKSS